MFNCRYGSWVDVVTVPNFIPIGQPVFEIWIWRFFDFFFKLAAMHPPHWICYMRLDQPRKVFAAICYSAKLGWIRCSSFDCRILTSFNIVRIRLDMRIQATKIGVVSPIWGAVSMRPKMALPCAEHSMTYTSIKSVHGCGLVGVNSDSQYFSIGQTTQKLPIPMRICTSANNIWVLGPTLLSPKQHLDPFKSFCRVQKRDQQTHTQKETDHATPSVCSSKPLSLSSAAMPPNDTLKRKIYKDASKLTKHKLQSKTADFAPGAANWRTRRNIRVDARLFHQLHANMTSSIKPEVHCRRGPSHHSHRYNMYRKFGENWKCDF